MSDKPKRFIYAHSKDLLWMLVFLRVQKAKRAGKKAPTKWQAPRVPPRSRDRELCKYVRKGWVNAAMKQAWSKDLRQHRVGDELTHWGNHIEYLKWRVNRNGKRTKAVRRQKDASWRALQSIRSRMRMGLCGIKKVKSTVGLLGCSMEQFKKHIESQFEAGMSWDNYGHSTWHIDHIVPCSKFDFTDPAQQRKAFHYTNQRPLWAKDNLAKGSKVMKQQCLFGQST